MWTEQFNSQTPLLKINLSESHHRDRQSHFCLSLRPDRTKKAWEGEFLLKYHIKNLNAAIVKLRIGPATGIGELFKSTGEESEMMRSVAPPTT